MNITYTFRHTNTSDALQKLTEDKLARLDKYVVGPVTAHLIVDTDGHHQMSLEIDFHSKGFHAVASASGNGADAYKILDDVVGKLERQIRKHKEKVKAHP